MSDVLGKLQITFGHPWWLLTLVLILPPLVFWSTRSLSGLGGLRRALAIGLRVLVIGLLVLALADLRAVQKSDTLTTLFLVDVSESLPNEWRDDIFGFVNGAARDREKPGDRAGVIAYGREAKVETPPVPGPLVLNRIENTIDGEHTDLADAIKLALASFPEDSARRIVVISDGNENQGNAVEQALAASALNVKIDVLPIEYNYDQEVLIEKIAVPSDVKQGDTVNLNVVIRAAAPTTGKLQIYQKADNYRSPIAEEPQPVTLERGINVRTIKQVISEPNFYTFTAEFIPDRDSRDQRAINNTADGFVYARGKAHVLLIEGSRGEHDELVQALRSKEIQVTTLTAPGVGTSGIEAGDPIPDDLAQLQPYDAVILANVPKDSFTDHQIQMFEVNCHDLGAGLVMLGGPNSFGAGRWNKTPVEQALPVDMEIKDIKVLGKSALVMVMHASEIPEGNFWQKVVAQEALKTLSPYDMAGVLHWQGQESWLFTLQNIGERKNTMLRAIDRMTPGDMPDSGPSLQMGMTALRNSDALTKHFIIISDGDPAPPTGPLVSQLIASKITVTTVLVAAHGGDMLALNWMQGLAQATKGRFYNVQNPKALPRIYQKEARLISRPLIYEQKTPWNVTIDPRFAASEIIAGFTGENLPPISGIVLSSLKENALVEVPLVSPMPKGQFNPLLAHWKYGLGRSVAFTSDAGRQWTTSWPSWEGYSAFWWQVIRWALRPVDDRNLSLSLRRDDGKIQVVVDALDKEDQFVNFLQFRGVALSPELDREGKPKQLTVPMVQTAPGRYEGTIEDADAKGNYFVALGYVGPDGRTSQITGGISVPYSEEYKELRSNAARLDTLADITGGRVLQWATRGQSPNIDMARTVKDAQVFRRDPSMTLARGSQPLWPSLLWWASFFFLADVAVRRIAPDVNRMRRSVRDAWKRLRGEEIEKPTEYIEKLRSRKREVTDQLDRSRAATQFEPPEVPTTPVDEPLLTGEAPATGPEKKPKSVPKSGGGLAPEQKAVQPESYADRLMKAKKKVWEEREKEQEKKNRPGPSGS